MSEWEQLSKLLEGVGEAELRALCIDALRVWHRGTNRYHFVVFSDFAPHLIEALAQRGNVRLEGRSLNQGFVNSLHYPQMGPILDFLWWLVRADLAIPLGVGQAQFPSHFHVTRAGTRFLEGTDQHPLSPGFVRRLRDRCVGIPDDTVALLEDAHACFERGLLRPAVMLLGVAFESAIEEVADALSASNLLVGPVPSRAAQRLASVRAAITTRFPGNAGPAIEARAAAQHACDFTDELRRRRNDGSHTSPRYPFDDRAEIEELMVSAGRHLPHLWGLR